MARHPRRPLTTDYIRLIVRDFSELHGDRAYRDDGAIMTGFGRVAGHKVMLVGHNKGKDTKERIACNFGCGHPEAYRKALLKMKLAAKYGLPVVCLIDTQGAYPGIGAEERGIAQAIATNLMEMSRLPTPIVGVVIGEGGSGGALGIGVGDRFAMLENAYYTVISPEGLAAILWKDSDKAPEAAEAMKLTAAHMLEAGIIDTIVREPLGGAHRDPLVTSRNVEQYLTKALEELEQTPIEQLLEERYRRYRNIGAYRTAPPAMEQAGGGRRPASSESGRRRCQPTPRPHRR